jgi:hypothetical protein
MYQLEYIKISYQLIFMRCHILGVFMLYLLYLFKIKLVLTNDKNN